MSVIKALRNLVAPELNHLYTVPPFHTPAGIDCGWYCREHALHTFIIARMFGAISDIRSGDFQFQSPYIQNMSSVGDDADHSWCSVSGVTPVDLSLTFAHFGGGPQLRNAIIGDGKNGDWRILYSEHESILEHYREGSNDLFLIEKSIEPHTEEDLLQNPYCFIFPPRAGDSTSWDSLYGQDIYAKISLHCFATATGSAKNVRSRFSSSDAVKWICQNYSNAAEEIRKKIK